MTAAFGMVLGVVQFLTVVWIGPIILRVTCLQFISSNILYYGDVLVEDHCSPPRRQRVSRCGAISARQTPTNRLLFGASWLCALRKQSATS